MPTARVKGELILRPGEYLKFDIEVPLEDCEIHLDDLDPATSSVRQVSASSLYLQADAPINTNVLGGSPQTNVRLLVLLSE